MLETCLNALNIRVLNHIFWAVLKLLYMSLFVTALKHFLEKAHWNRKYLQVLIMSLLALILASNLSPKSTSFMQVVHILLTKCSR